MSMTVSNRSLLFTSIIQQGMKEREAESDSNVTASSIFHPITILFRVAVDSFQCVRLRVKHSISHVVIKFESNYFSTQISPKTRTVNSLLRFCFATCQQKCFRLDGENLKPAVENHFSWTIISSWFQLHHVFCGRLLVPILFLSDCQTGNEALQFFQSETDLK